MKKMSAKTFNFIEPIFIFKRQLISFWQNRHV